MVFNGRYIVSKASLPEMHGQWQTSRDKLVTVMSQVWHVTVTPLNFKKCDKVVTVTLLSRKNRDKLVTVTFLSRENRDKLVTVTLLSRKNRDKLVTVTRLSRKNVTKPRQWQTSVTVVIGVTVTRCWAYFSNMWHPSEIEKLVADWGHCDLLDMISFIKVDFTLQYLIF